MFSTNDQTGADIPLTTALHNLHTGLNGKMVDFAGYLMPVQFPAGIKTEHLHTRSHAGLFDVSHMGQIRITGEDAAAALEKLVTGDIMGLRDYQQRYTLLTNPQGGIIDDLMVTRLPEGLFLVVNAACKQNDFTHIRESLPVSCEIEMLDNQSLIALQGPKAACVLDEYNEHIGELGFLNAGHYEIKDMPCFIHRCGYSGEDGFEISLANEYTERLAELLLKNADVISVGLGARDSLRLEAGLCLYGHDIDTTTTPVEAQLQWTIAKKYRDGSVEAQFPGAGIILKQLESGVTKRFVGLQPEGKMPVREGVVILNNESVDVGLVSSGGFAPSFGRPVAMGYVSSDFADVGTELQVEVRNHLHKIHVADLPFVKHQYYKP